MDFLMLNQFQIYENNYGFKFEEEELEWIPNKDAFHMVESLIQPTTACHVDNHHPTTTTATTSSTSSSSVGSHVSSSTTSVGGGAVSALVTGFKPPTKARSNHARKRRGGMMGQQWYCWPQAQAQHRFKKPSSTTTTTSGRKCLHCLAEKTPQWRAGPLGPKTLCNACGVRYKSGRLVPEYRPASSPTFRSSLHSNSHRKIMEMRKLSHKFMMVNNG